MTTPTKLYRHFDENNTLLYVGISLAALNRLAQHKTNAPWFGNIATVTMETYQTRELALEAEQKAIIDEKPLHNIIHHPVNIRSYPEQVPLDIPVLSDKLINLLLSKSSSEDWTVAKAEWELLNLQFSQIPIRFARVLYNNVTASKVIIGNSKIHRHNSVSLSNILHAKENVLRDRTIPDELLNYALWNATICTWEYELYKSLPGSSRNSIRQELRFKNINYRVSNMLDTLFSFELLLDTVQAENS